MSYFLSGLKSKEELSLLDFSEEQFESSDCSLELELELEDSALIYLFLVVFLDLEESWISETGAVELSFEDPLKIFSWLDFSVISRA